ncbi:hypothetical protein [Pseudomonas sp.]|uniref:hypothetical protein n=1 Tax=Pseudomonas sp. TaxID=306 RepID=UPI00260CC8D6|nr:hypothetical protein [Pseudomonas sp.]
MHNAPESPLETILAISTLEQIRVLHVWATGFDGIIRGRVDAESWLAALEGYDMNRVRAAITEHYRRNTWRVMPANIIEIIEAGEA